MQNIKNIRVDVRMIHGQVAAVWVNTLGITRIIVCDKLATSDNVLIQVLKLACPANVKLSILSPEKTAANLLDNKYDGDNIMIVARTPKSLVDLYEAGYHMEKINVGNMASRMGSQMIKRTVHVTEDDINDFKKLMGYGVTFTAEMMPGEDYFDFPSAIEKIKF